MQDQTEKGADALRRYLGKRLSVDDPIVEIELRSILAAVKIDLKRMLLGCGGQFMQVSQ